MYQIFHNRTSYLSRKTKGKPKSTISWNFSTSVVLNALNTKSSRYYKNWLFETSRKKWAGAPLRLKHWKTWKYPWKSSKSIVMSLDVRHPHNWQLFFLIQLVQIICPHGWTRWAMGFSSQLEHKSLSSSSSPSQNRSVLYYLSSSSITMGALFSSS